MPEASLCALRGYRLRSAQFSLRRTEGEAAMMSSMIPASPEQLSDEWLTLVLRQAGVLRQARVTAHRAELAETQGAAGVVARLEFEYDRAEAGAPHSLVAKFASPYEPIRRLMQAVGGYVREVEFYRHFGADPGIPTPHCFHADIDPASGVFVLLLEDMGDARVPDGSGASIDDIELAVRHLAPFHAKWWADPRLRELDFLRYPGGPADEIFLAQAHGALAAAFPAARERFGERLPVSLVAVAEFLLVNFDLFLETRRQAPRDAVTLVHGDFHPGQIFYPSQRGGRFAVFDWQTVSAGSGGEDLARIITTGLAPEQQRACDARLIELYHALLVEHGVAGYDIARCRDDFRMGLVTTVAMNIIASVNIDPAFIEEFEASSDVPVTDTMFGWLAAALEAHGVLDALPA